MNSTNRGANRLLILVFGLLLLVAGAVVAAAALIPAAQELWVQAAAQVSWQVLTWLQLTPLGITGVSWIMPGILVLLLLAVILLIVFIARQGGGRTAVAITEPGPHGATIIDAAVAEQAMQEALTERQEFVATGLSTYKVRGTPVLKVSVSCRRGVSPKDAATIVEDRLRALDEVLGRQLPALIHIGGGLRSRVSSTTRLQ